MSWCDCGVAPAHELPYANNASPPAPKRVFVCSHPAYSPSQPHVTQPKRAVTHRCTVGCETTRVPSLHQLRIVVFADITTAPNTLSRVVCNHTSEHPRVPFAWPLV